MRSRYYHFLLYKPLCFVGLLNLFLQLKYITFVIQNNYNMLMIAKFGTVLYTVLRALKT